MPEFQRGEKRRQRSSSERMGLACCWDRRRAIALLRTVVGDATVSTPAAKWVPTETIIKMSELLEDLEHV